MIRSVRSSLLKFLAVPLIVAAVGQAQSISTHHVRDEVRRSQAQHLGRLPQSQTLQLDLVLSLRDPAGLKAFLSELYNPSSASYRHFLSVQEFTDRFGPSQDDYDTVVQFAKDRGFDVVGGSRDGMDVQIKGPIWAIENAFHVNMSTYQHPKENRTFYGPDREPTVDLPFKLWHISGLDNYSVPQARVVKRADYAAAHGITPDAVVSHATTGSGPSASFLGSDMRAAYYGSGSLTGSGQSLGLLEYYGTNLADVTTYYKNVGQTNSVPISLVSTDGTSTACTYPSCDDTEQTLDITQALGMAPGLSSLVVYVGSTDTAIISAMTTHNPLPATIGCSWGWTPVDPTMLDPYFQRMAAQGQNFFAASGDNGPWGKTSSNGAWPADDPYVVSVGGTDLVTASAGGPWASETAWVDSGGGINLDKIAIPAWQQLAGVINTSNKGSTTLRNGPDVSANSNFTFYVCADQTTCTANSYGGTSFAAPMWAGYIALVNQQLAAGSKSPIGFMNPTIYAQNVTSGYTSNFHDITTGSSTGAGGSFPAVTGFDLVTGWGSPNAGLIAALTGAASTPGFTLSASPASISVAPGAASSSTITSSVSGGFNSAISLTASGQPTGVTLAFTPSTITGAGSSSLSITVASTTVAGTYPITITGTSGSTVSTTSIALTVTGTNPNFSLSAAPTAITVARSSSGTVSITSAVTGGFNSAISLTASGQGSGTTLSFSPSSITGAGSSTMTITASRRATRGTRTITITGKSGTTTHTTTVSLTVQ